jgi:hypothetical protein
MLEAILKGPLEAARAIAAPSVDALPAQLRSVNLGQSVYFQRKTVDYYDKLVESGQIDPRTVTKDEFIAKAQSLAAHDPFAWHWSQTASRMVALAMVGDTLVTGNRERAEREAALYQLQQVREIGLKQVEARTQSMGRDENLISPAALKAARERAANS